MKLDTGSAIRIPSVPRWKIEGRMMISGITMITLRKIEKNTAFFAFPRPTKIDWPANWKAIMKKPKK